MFGVTCVCPFGRPSIPSNHLTYDLGFWHYQSITSLYLCYSILVSEGGRDGKFCQPPPIFLFFAQPPLQPPPPPPPSARDKVMTHPFRSKRILAPLAFGTIGP